MRFAKLTIDAISFWVGAIVASAFWLMLGRARPAIRDLREKWQKKRAEASLRESSSVEEKHRQAVLNTAQGMHLAAPLFSLDEILVPPKLVAPPPQIEPGDEFIAEDQTNLSVPYLPEDSRLAAFYRTETLTLAEALSGNTHLALLGQAGTGKSVALAYLATLSAKRDPALGKLAKSIPFLLHIADMDLPAKNKGDLLTPLIRHFSANASLFNAARIPKFVQFSFEQGRALLLLDGLDELPQNKIAESVAYLKELLEEYPAIRVAVTASMEYLDELISLDFAPLTVKTWDRAEQKKFLDRWGSLWKNYVSLEAWVQAGPEEVDPLLLNNWIYADSAHFSPLELTLKTWGAYAGDGRGGTPLAAIETHLLRLSPNDIPIAALETLAMQAHLSENPTFSAREARGWIKSFEPPEEEIDVEESDKEEEIKAKRGLLTKMQESGLLTRHSENRLRFIHPLFGGYLAGRGLSNYQVDERLADQPRWSGQSLSMHYLAALGDPSPVVETLLKKQDHIIERNLTQISRWLKDAPPKSKWRGKVLSALAAFLQDDTRPLGLRGQIIIGLALSADKNVAALFRQLLQAESTYITQLAALGSGLMQDKKAVPVLSDQLGKTRNTYAVSAICLALAAIGTDSALETLATFLMQGEENARRAAAEAFANHPEEGWDTLKEALGLDDILLRRSAIYGLARIIKEPWTKELLEHAQIEDKEWAVRDIAASILEKEKNPNPRIPRRLSPPSETPWLITFAGQQGMGISPGAPATDLLLNALKSEDIDQSLAALPYLRNNPSEGVINALYHAMYGKNIAMREAVFLTLNEIAASGVTLPNPKAYGLG